MITLAEWTNIRRVDHLNVAGFHPRYRAFNLTNLKAFDGGVQAFAGAHNAFDKATLLGRIIQQARAYQGQEVPQRYRTAIGRLLQSATAELNQLCGMAMGSEQIPTDLDNLALGPLATKNVLLNIYFLAPVGATPELGPIDEVINDHIANANHAYNQAGVTFLRAKATTEVVTQTVSGEPILYPAVGSPILQHLWGTFSDGAVGGRRLITYCNGSDGVPNSIDVVYLNRYDQADVKGKTFRAHQNHQGATPVRPIVTVTLNPPVDALATYPTTLAHELGHAMTGVPDHSAEGNNLMAGGNIRTGANLTAGQLVWLRNTQYAT